MLLEDIWHFVQPRDPRIGWRAARANRYFPWLGGALVAITAMLVVVVSLTYE